MKHQDRQIPPLQLQSLVDPSRPITAKWVNRGDLIGFDRLPNEREDKVIFVIPHKDTGVEQLVAIISPQTLSRLSGKVPFDIATSNDNAFRLSPQESTRLSCWAQSGVAHMAAERNETIKHGSARVLCP